MDADLHDEPRGRIRWGNVARAAALLALVALIVAWPRLAGDVPRVPDAAAVPVAPVEAPRVEAPPQVETPRREQRRRPPVTARRSRRPRRPERPRVARRAPAAAPRVVTARPRRAPPPPPALPPDPAGEFPMP